jgi:hypothetical protein
MPDCLIASLVRGGYSVDIAADLLRDGSCADYWQCCFSSIELEIRVMFKSPSNLIAVLMVSLLCSANANARWYQGSWNGLNDPLFEAHHIDSYEMTLSDTGGVASVYYPNTRGKDARNHPSNDSRFPIVVLLGGGGPDARQLYSTFAKGVAQYGFVFVLPNNASSVFNSASFNDVHLITAVLNEMRKEESDPDSPVYGIVDSSRLALSGHSFGGVTALTAIGGFCQWPFCDVSRGFQRPPELEAAVLLAAHAGELAIDNSGVPVAILTGDGDRAFDDYRVGYDKLEPPKAFIVVEGTAHLGPLDVQPFGVATDRGEPEQIIPSSIAAGRWARWAGLFLRAHMHGDWRANMKIYRSGGTDGVTVEGERR